LWSGTKENLQMYRVSPCLKTQICVTRPQCVNTYVEIRPHNLAINSRSYSL